MKALVLTRQLNDLPEELKLISESNILKIAVNHAPARSDYRVFSDYDMWHFYDKPQYINRGERLVTTNAGMLALPNHIWMYYKPVSNPNPNDVRETMIVNHRQVYTQELFYYGGSIIPATDLAIKLGATEILLIADNTVYYEEFQETIKKSMNKLKAYCDISCFKAENNFNLPYKDLAKFLQGE